jgi:hypothetical protein
LPVWVLFLRQDRLRLPPNRGTTCPSLAARVAYLYEGTRKGDRSIQSIARYRTNHSDVKEAVLAAHHGQVELLMVAQREKMVLKLEIVVSSKIIL